MFGYVETGLDKKAKVSCKFYDITDWAINNCNTHIAHYLKMDRQSGNEIWSVNKRRRGKYFSSKIIHKIRLGD